MENENSLSVMIGQRVGERRVVLGLSLEELAARTSVSRAMISRIERGEVHASAVVLARLCAGIGITLSELFAQTAASPLLRRADQPVWQDPVSGYVRREVAPAGTSSSIKIVDIEFPAHAEVSFEAGSRRIADQYVVVLEGCIEIETLGSPYRLGSGDCLRMKVVEGNRFRNPGDRPARYLAILAMEGSP